MNKLFKFFLTSAAISAALVGAVSCQKDFAPDIESLNKKVAELTQKLTDLQTKIDAGEVVTNVTTTAGGITVTTNKGTYNIVNGKDGMVLLLPVRMARMVSTMSRIPRPVALTSTPGMLRRVSM